MEKPTFGDWPVLGPVTGPWLLKYMHVNGGSPLAFHHRWIAEVRLDYSATGTAEHLLLCRVLELMVTYDGLNATQLASTELIPRKIQMIHEPVACTHLTLPTNREVSITFVWVLLQQKTKTIYEHKKHCR